MTWVMLPTILVAMLKFLVHSSVIASERSNLAPNAHFLRDCFVACGSSQ
jgi:hypothetical protein